MNDAGPEGAGASLSDARPRGRLVAPVAALLGAVTGCLVAAAIAIGESQSHSAAGGAVRGIGTNAILIVAPQWATVVALATALLVIGGLAAAWEVTRRRGYRTFWVAVLLPLVALVAVGTALSPDALDPSRSSATTEVLAGAAHSPLLSATLIAVSFVVTRSRQSGAGGRLER